MPQENVGIRWVVPPETLAAAIERYGDRVITAVTAVAGRVAGEMANSARANAPWTDRTANARTGLFGTAERDMTQQVVTIFLSHSAVLDYPLWLELANAGNYAIIMRTIESHLPELRAELDQLLR
jgi:hypothetical protein